MICRESPSVYGGEDVNRTFLNYFLSQELETELALEKERSQLADQDNLRDV
ncbi:MULTISPECIES: hypothetical protein [Microcystis]|uniref:Uncharacterized protein n=1 Tax=Microcystis panniformis FACHB-1757 TaxID=1638788 RepID=A0A0K1RWN2_9CHRO|nr:MULTISPECIES: hypothetical protein [Microcystis]AKV66178.1 hypothetical protein VL20_989 [Microcystis panniformis FACHB-1757]MBE9075424.1 hypothetical protein [Microcystis sp. LEGE 08355]